ncbi:MAG: DUF4537 domain-containing protein [Leptospira sp.]|nr:DUF4537 domain-containing protein [Leptospira sp.]
MSNKYFTILFILLLTSNQLYTNPTNMKKGFLPNQEQLNIASLNGKYRILLETIYIPEDDINELVHEDGFYSTHKYKNRVMPEGYYTYSNSHWFVWKEIDLVHSGYKRISKSIQLKEKSIKLEMEFLKKNENWAEESIEVIAKGIQFIESFTGVPYPGNQTYRIFETQTLQTLGRANSSRMLIASPPKGSIWTQMHEIVHIWNVGTKPRWISEGLANFISYLIMRDHSFSYIDGDRYENWIGKWFKERIQKKDLPLNDPFDQYDKIAQGKALVYWCILYELGGESLIKDIFTSLVSEKNLSNRKVSSIFNKYEITHSDKLLSGWITKGNYYGNFASDYGEVRHSLPEIDILLTSYVNYILSPKNQNTVKVWAKWSDEKWYLGILAGSCPKGKIVLFEDGDMSCTMNSKIVQDILPGSKDVKYGSRVLAKWRNGKYYPGTVSQIENKNYTILFDDEEKLSVELKDLRLIPENELKDGIN